MAESFENLTAWKEAKNLALLCYKITKHFPREEQFALTNQIRRAAVSIISNIAEGASRTSFKDRVHFLDIAIGSIFELKAQFILSKEIGYISLDELAEVEQLSSHSLKLIYGYKNYLKKDLI